MSGRKNPKQATVNLLWARAAGHCELCGRDVTYTLSSGHRGKYGEVAHIEAYSPDGPRFNAEQTEDERNAIDNLMLLCPSCHKDIDEHPGDYSVDFLKSRKLHYEESVKLAVDAVGSAETDVITFAQCIGSNEYTISEKDWRDALIDAGVNAGNAGVINAAKGVPCGYGPDTLRALRGRIDLYLESIHTNPTRRTSVFAFAPQPALIGLGTMLADDGSVDVYQKRRGTDSWSWESEGEQNEFAFDELVSGVSEDCALVVSVSGLIHQDTYAAALPKDVGSIYELRAVSAGPSAIRLKNDWLSFKRAASESLYAIHDQHPEMRRLHIFPAMPISACVAFGMAWNERLIPEIIVYEKDDATFHRALSIGGSDGFAE